VGILYDRVITMQTAQHWCIHSHLEYGVALTPHQQGIVNSLQCRSLCLNVHQNWDADYDSLFQSCNFSSLASRSNCLKLCFLYQVIWMCLLRVGTWLEICATPVPMHFRGLWFTLMPTKFHSFRTPLHCGLLSSQQKLRIIMSTGKL